MYGRMVNKNRGFLRAIILIVVALIILGYFRIDIRQVLSSGGVQTNLSYAWHLVLQGFMWVWQTITGFIVEYFPFLDVSKVRFS
jgi:hypothetical protein